MADLAPEIIESIYALEKAADEEGKQKRATLWGLLRYLHDIGTLARFITVETRAFNPLVIALDPAVASPTSQAYIHSFLVSTWLGVDPENLPKPWGYVCWEWPTRRLVAVMDLKPFGNLPDVTLTHKDLLDRDYCDAIEAALKTGGEIPRPSSELAKLYQGFLLGLGASMERRQTDPALLARFEAPPPPPPLPTEGFVIPPGKTEITGDEILAAIDAAHAVPLPPAPEVEEPGPPEPVLVAPMQPFRVAPDSISVEPEAPEIDAEARKKVSEAIEAVQPGETKAEESLEDTKDLQDFIKKIE